MHHLDQGPPARILVVENDSGLAQQLQSRLAAAGHTVDLAQSSQEGLSQALRHSYDLLAVNLAVAGDDGLELMRRLLAQGALPTTVIVTANGDETRAQEALHLGAAELVIKSSNGQHVERLSQAIQQALDRRELVAHLDQTQKGLERYRASLVQLNRAGQALTTSHDLQEILGRLLEALVSIVGADGGSVWLLSRDGALLTCKAVFHQENVPQLLNLTLRPGEGIAGWVAQQNQPAVVDQTAQDERFASAIDGQSGFQTLSLLAVPLRLPDRVIGVLEAVNKREGPFDEQDQAIAETLAAWAAIAIENARLVSELRHRTADLEARNHDLDAFGHTVAHDLKNPLGLIAAYAELLDSRWDTMTPVERERCLRGILNSTDKMESIIEELLIMSGLRESKVAIVPLHMNEILREAWQHLRHMFDRYDGKLEIPDDWPQALGHAPWVEQIWVNYISNALKYGGRPPVVTLGATPQTDGMIRFWVRDNGPGLSETERAQLFTPFTQLSQTEVGHGLGLSIVRQIVEKLGGRVDVIGDIGQGSEFGFTLPAAPVDPFLT